MNKETLLGYDIGSSSVKAGLLEISTGKVLASATSPETEMKITAIKSGWAEQEPELWWEHLKRATEMVKKEDPSSLKGVKAVGISYQMHGLVCLDASGKVLRPSIIWCDSRAVPYGEDAFKGLGEQFSLEHFLNSPGNFTAAKLAWVKDQEPEIFEKTETIMLPGDYISYRLTGEKTTTPSGLSEGVLWDAKEEQPALSLMEYFGFSSSLLPEIKPNFSEQGLVHDSAAKELGIPKGVPVSYRGGDQPNNALSLNVLSPGELATTAGTSGVVYGVIDKPSYDPKSRVNTFVHVNHSRENPRYGVLLCLNGTGILNRWIKQNCIDYNEKAIPYDTMNTLAKEVPIGAEGLFILPYGNGAERTLENRNPGASVHNLNFNIHTRKHLLRAGQEGIVYALGYGLQIMKDMGLRIDRIKAGQANMFLSPLFSEAFANLSGAVLELYNTDGSQGAARGAGIGAGLYAGPKEAFSFLEKKQVIEPSPKTADQYREAYEQWLSLLKKELGSKDI